MESHTPPTGSELKTTILSVLPKLQDISKFCGLGLQETLVFVIDEIHRSLPGTERKS